MFDTLLPNVLRSLLELDPWTFDQDPTQGWRWFPEAPQRIQAIQEYLKRHSEGPATWKPGTPGSNESHQNLPPYAMAFHLGQIYACLGGFDDVAATLFAKAAAAVEHEGWKAYCHGTICFLMGDRLGLESRYQRACVETVEIVGVSSTERKCPSGRIETNKLEGGNLEVQCRCTPAPAKPLETPK